MKDTSGPWDDYAGASDGPWRDYAPAATDIAQAPAAAPGFLPTIKRTSGQMLTTGARSLEDVTGPNVVTQGMRDIGQGIIDRNPAGITKPGDILDSPWLAVKEAVGQFVPQIGAAVAGSAAGAALGGRIAGAPGAAVGGAVGGFAPILSQTYGGARQDQDEQGVDDIPRALASAAGSAALERFALNPFVKGLRAPGSVAVGTIPREIGKGIVREGVTEAAQTPIEQWGGYRDPTTPESLSETALSGIMGGIGGGVVGGANAGVQRAFARRQPQAEPSQADQQQEQLEQQSPLEPALAAPDTAQPVAPAPGDAIRAVKLPDGGPLASAVNVAIDEEARAVDAGVPTSAPVASALLAATQRPAQDEPALPVEQPDHLLGAETPAPRDREHARATFDSRSDVETFLSGLRRGNAMGLGGAVPVQLDAQRWGFVQRGEAGYDQAVIEQRAIADQRRAQLTGAGISLSQRRAAAQAARKAQEASLPQPATQQAALTIASPAPAQAAAQAVSTAPAPTATTTEDPALDAAAHAAATSHLNDSKTPTPAQLSQGNYKKGHYRLESIGKSISIETAKGTERVAKDGSWRVPQMPAHYGDINRTEGANGDPVDIFIGDRGDNGRYWVINQKKPGGGFDEHKILTGVDSADEATAIYKGSFTDGFGDKVFESISAELTAEQMKAMLPSLKKAKPVPAAAAEDRIAAAQPATSGARAKNVLALRRERAAAAARGDGRAVREIEALIAERQAASIADAGEKIGGARKDRWRERGLAVADLDAMTEAEGAELATKANVWKPDFTALAAQSDALTAALVKVMYDRLAAAPRHDTPAGRREYVTALQSVRQVFGAVTSAEDASTAHLRLREALGVRSDAGLRALDPGSPEGKARRVLFSVYKGRSDPFVFGYDERQRAVRLVAEGFPGKVEPWRRRFSIVERGGPGTTPAGIRQYAEAAARLETPLTDEQISAGVFVVRGKTGGDVGYASDRAGAEALAAAQYRKSLERESGALPERPHLDRIEREGVAAGVDHDVSAQELLDRFGFRGVEFGNWAAQDERQRLLNFAHDALSDLATILNVPPRALSLDGTLGIAFGARGGGKAAAHYEPGKLVINMTKVNGAGSLAHEWAHAFDHYLGELARDDAYKAKARGASGWYSRMDYAPGRTAARLPQLRPELAEKIDDVMTAIFGPRLRPTAYAKEAIKLSGKSASGYWARPTEMLARAFESYVFDRLANMGARSQYLVQGVEQERFASGYKGNPYPLGDERIAIHKAFDAFVAELKTREGVRGGVALFNTKDDPYTGQADENAAADRSLSARRAIGLLERGVALTARGAGADSLHPFVARRIPGDEELRRVAAAFGERFQGFDLRPDLLDADRERFGFFNGAFLNGTIYLRATGVDRPHLAVLGHEMAHRLAASRPELYREFVVAIRPYVNQSRYASEFRKSAVAREVTDDELLRQEFVGEVLSDAFMDRAFWSALGDKSPGLLARVVAFVRGLIDKAISTVGYDPKTARILSDYRHVIEIAADVMAKYAQGSAAPDSAGIAFNRSEERAERQPAAPGTGAIADALAKGGNTLAHYRGMALQALGRRQLVELYARDLPQLLRYSDLVQRMDADKNEAGAQADAIATAWGKLDDEQQLAELMHDATLAQIDPAKAHDPADSQLTYKRLRGRYDALSDEARATYLRARDAYAQHRAAVRQALHERIERAEMSSERRQRLLKHITEQFDNQVKGVYFPLARFGKYVIVVRNRAGEVVNVSRAETLNEAATQRTALQREFKTGDGFAVGKVLKDREFNAAREGVGRGFMSDLYETLERTGAGEELLDAVGQLYLASLPDVSWAKHGLHRKGMPGFSQDARRAFAQNMFHGARYLAKLRYADQLHSQIEAMQKHVEAHANDDGYDSVRAQQVVDEMVKRHEQLMNPTTHPVATALTSIGFVFHLGLSPAAAIVNLSGTLLVAYPMMAAKWGFRRAGAALMRASKEAAGSRNDLGTSLVGDEAAAFAQAVRAGVIDVTQAHDLAGIADGEDSKVSWKLRPVMRWASFMFHHAERFNRQVTFLAAYRLARGAGANATDSYDQAVKATYDSHFDYGASNRPRIMQGNWQRVILLFKQYAQNMIFTLTRQAQLSLRGETPEARSQARKALGGLLAMHAAAAGAFGLPIVNTLLAAASMLSGDDDEPWDAKTALQNMLADAFGQKPAEVIAHGLSRLTPWDISGRVGLDKLLLPDVYEGLEGQRLAEAWMASALGPVAGIAVNAVKGLGEMEHGRWMRGLEEMMPAALRGPLRALRLADEGAQDRGGASILDDVSAAGVAGQALGFSPSELRNAMEGRAAVLREDRALSERRGELLAGMARAILDGNPDAASEAGDAIATFNAKNPLRAIGPEHVQRSVMERARRAAQSQGGVYLPKSRRDALEAGRFAFGE